MKKIIFSLFSLILWTVVGFAQISKDSRGTDFWLMFNSNENTSTPLLYISSDVNTSGVVSVPGISFTQPFTVVANTITVITLPTSLCLHTNDVVDNNGIHVTSLQDVTVYGLNRQPFTTDAYLGLPIDAIGKDYIVLSYKNSNVVNGSELGIVGTVDGTVVTITPRLTTLTHTAGVPFNILLNQGQTYELQDVNSTGDVTGTTITSTQPIGVMGSSRCANIPAGALYCDHICEMLPPISAWGKNFGAVPLAGRNGGDTWRFLASEDGTVITIDGVNETSINKTEFIEKVITGRSFITSNKPILVAQYCNGQSFGNSTTGDPFMMLVLPLEQFLSSYTLSTVPGFTTNYVNIIAPTSNIGSITLDGSLINSGAFIAIGTSGQSGAQIAVSNGTHNLSSALPFGVFQYGFTDFDSYGYSGGGLFAPISFVSFLTLSPTTGNSYIGIEKCFNATVTDQNGNPLSGVRVDFTVTGANTISGFGLSDSLGVAKYCYTGTNVGNDNIVASIASLNATSTFTWKSLPTITVTATPPTQQYSDKVTLVANVSPLNCKGASNLGSTITFKIGTLTMGTAIIDINGIATLADVSLLEPSLDGNVPTNGPLAPGNKIVTAIYNGNDVDCTLTNQTTSLIITCEDARAYYTGAYYSSTASPNSSSATVTLSATIKDITAVTGDLAYDANNGDIRNATVSFINVDTNAVIATVPIGLVNAGDTKVGTATYNWNTTISADAQQFLIGIRVNNYYCRYSSEDDAIITVAKPLGSYFITGGGYLNLSNSAGIKAGDQGTKNNFGFNVKYNKSKTNLQGNINIIVRRTESGLLHVYQIKGNVMTSLAVNENCPKTATFNGKANITDITNPLTPFTVDGNGTLQVKMTDSGEPGTFDKIAITLWNKNGGLWYVSNWNGTTTTEQILGGGNLKVHGGSACSNSYITKTNTTINLNPKNENATFNVKVYPNPFANNFMIDLKTASQSIVNLKVYDMVGRLIENREVTLSDLETTTIGEHYPSGIYNVFVSQEFSVKTVRVVKR